MMSPAGALCRLVRHGLLSRGPAYLVYFVTARCNARCEMCFYWRETDECATRRELSIDEIDMFSKSMGRLFQVVLSGGEPFIRHDLAEVALTIARNCRPTIITIPTNGSMPDRIVPVIETICRSVPKTMVRVNISIDGIGPEHDSIRRLSGCFDKAVETFRRLRTISDNFTNLTVNVATVLSNSNKNNIDEIVQYVHENLRPDHHGLGWTRGEPRDEKAKDVKIDVYERVTDALTAETGPPERLFPLRRLQPVLGRELYRLVAQTYREQRQVVPCLAGKNMIVVDDRGVVYPCEMLAPFLKWHPVDTLESAAMGTLRDQNYSVPKILNSPHAVEVRKFIGKGHCYCTYECALAVSLLFNPLLYPRLARAALTKTGTPS